MNTTKNKVKFYDFAPKKDPLLEAIGRLEDTIKDMNETITGLQIKIGELQNER